MATGFALSVDLGTSHTVAVLRVPDGRTRPLLFDGQPLLPSAVFLDDSGSLRVGGDALRLAKTDPARLEPSPKRRIDEGRVLLGRTEVPVVDLLAAVLTRVGSAAVEAAGHLPSVVVLTHPAQWGAPRRALLLAAAARAGWPMPALVAEPVAAAYYFAEVLRRPVPVGNAVAVFDFGGGTLDVAVVRNTGSGFAVAALGGVAELGGLDLDAALVMHLGEGINRLAPQTWQRISRPATVRDARDRRFFWEDVRGSKEMLSRTVVAPIPVPGTDSSIHLTRDELEQVVGPLVARAVATTGDVLRAAAVPPDQLTGLFLVGGSSRVPLVARMLHTELGVAPTVLEQPEIPVAEGALVGQPVGPAPQSVPPQQAQPQQSQPPQAQPARAQPKQAQPPVAGRRVRRPLVIAGATLLVVLLLVCVGVVWIYRGRQTITFAEQFSAVGSPVVAVTGDEAASPLEAQALGSRAFFAAQRADDKQVELVAIGLGDGQEQWRARTGASSSGWEGIRATEGAVLVFDGRTADNGTVYAFSPEDGRQLWRSDLAYSGAPVYAGGALIGLRDLGTDREQLVAYDLATGAERWHIDLASAYGNEVLPVHVGTELSVPTAPGAALPAVAHMPKRLVLVTDDGAVQVIDAATGEVTARRGNVVAVGTYRAWAQDNDLFVATVSAGYRIDRFDLDSMAGPEALFSSTDTAQTVAAMIRCGADRLCVLEQSGDTVEAVRISATGSADPIRWPVASGANGLTPIGEWLLVTGPGTDPQLFDPENQVQFVPQTQNATVVRLDDRTAVAMTDGSTASSGQIGLTGLELRAGSAVPVPELTGAGTLCAWTDRRLACPTVTGEDNRLSYGVWDFRR